MIELGEPYLSHDRAVEAARNSILDSHRPIECVQRDYDQGDGPFPFSGDHLDQQGILK